MKIIAINGSPRKKWNTATLLKKALAGAASRGARTKLIHLYDLKYQGCNSCFACKQKGGKSYGKCVVKDALKPIFKQIEESDAIIFGSPIYLGHVTGEMQSFMERLVFPYLTYTDPPQSLFPKKIPTGFIYTMGITAEQMQKLPLYGNRFCSTERFLTMVFGSSKTLLSFDTYQFKDYSKVVAFRFDPEAKLKRREKVFPKDCQRAFKLGVQFAQPSNARCR